MPLFAFFEQAFREDEYLHVNHPSAHHDSQRVSNPKPLDGFLSSLICP
jgi:hypothetical protein